MVRVVNRTSVRILLAAAAARHTLLTGAVGAGATLLDLPGRLPLPSKITVEVRPPIDLVERFGPEPEYEQVYDEVTGEMQDALSELQDERTLPVVG